MNIAAEVAEVVDGRDPARDHLVATPILDFDRFPAELARVSAAGGDGAAGIVRSYHRWIGSHVRSTFSVAEQRPASVTVRRGEGSCSQRFAVLEALARRAGVPTRVQGLAVPGGFWTARFPRRRRVLPKEVMVCWPQFWCNRQWVSVDSLWNAGSAHSGPGLEADYMGLACPDTGFSNLRGTATLFEAVSTGSLGPVFAEAGSVHLGVYATRDAFCTAHRTRFRGGAPGWAAEAVLAVVSHLHRRQYRDGRGADASAGPPVREGQVHP